MIKYAKVKDKQNLIRDMHSKAILNTDISVVQRYEQKMAEEHKQKLQEDKINNLERELSELKDLIKKLIP